MPVVCPSCAGDSVERIGDIRAAFVFASHHLSHKLPGGALYRCERCALGFRCPAPTRETLDTLYRTSSLDHWQYQPERRDDWRFAREWLEDNSRSRTVLDVGCYDGAFAEYLGASWSAYGIEINEEACRKAEARGMAIVGRHTSELAGIDREFDAVVGFDVIEHVTDPAALLSDMRDATTAGGYIIVGSGNLDAPSWKLMGSAYWYCTIPEHLVFISRTWCERIADDLDLELVATSEFSHEQHRTLKLSAHELASNTLYRFAPGLFAALRRAGWGDKDVSANSELAYFPPTWTTAKDHIIAIFKKA